MSVQEKSAGGANSTQRVKVYRLNGDGKWDDQGTGHVNVDSLEKTEELSLFVIDEHDNETLLLHHISSQDIYRKQEDTIISWRDPEYSTELALSFQEPTGCSYIWDHICNAQRNIHFGSLNGGTFNDASNELRELPVVELSSLPLILKTISESEVTDHIRVAELILNDHDFLTKLMDMFHICEDLENVDGLHMIFRIVRGIILLNNPHILDKMFGDDMMMDVIGALEHDPDASHVQHHRSFLKENSIFKEAIPIKSPIVLSKIHQTYKVGYMKDVILPRVLDDSMATSLNSIINANNAVVISLLKDDASFIQELFETLKSPFTSSQSKKTMIYFLHEFCNISKSLQVAQQHRLFRELVSEGIFNIIEEILHSIDKRLVLIGTDILILFMNHDPNLLRSHITSQDGSKLFENLVKGMVTDFGEDMNCQFLEIIKGLLDSYTLLSGQQKDVIFEIFYEKHLCDLVEVITSSCPVSNGGEVDNSVKPEILLNICDLLCFSVIHYPYRIKCNFVLINVVDKVLLLTRRREKHLVVAGVRFVRTILSQHDEQLINHIIMNNLLQPIIEVFVSNGARYNLLHSVVLELFEYIRKENLKPLLQYLVDSFWQKLAKFEYLTTIEAIKIKYDQNLEGVETKGVNNSKDTRRRLDARALEKEEEAYFNEDSEEEDVTSSVSQSPRTPSQPSLENGSSKFGGLVDYEDDEDDEDYRPPPKRQPEGTNEEEGLVMEPLKLKRKPVLGDDHDDVRKQRLSKNPKPNRSNVVSQLSPLTQGVLPAKLTVSKPPPSTDGPSGTTRDPETEAIAAYSRRCCVGNPLNTTTVNNCSEEPFRRHLPDSDDTLNAVDGDENTLFSPKSSPEMRANLA